MSDNLSEKEILGINQILIRQLDLRSEQLVPEAKIMGDLGADSLDIVEISMAVEEEFTLTIPDESWDRVSTVGELYEAVGELVVEQRKT